MAEDDIDFRLGLPGDGFNIVFPDIYAFGIHLDKNGNYFLLGGSGHSPWGPTYPYFIRKYDHQLNLLKELAFCADSVECPWLENEIAEDNLGNIVFAYTTKDEDWVWPAAEFCCHVFLAKYDNDLNPINTIEIDPHGGNLGNHISGITVDKDNNIYICGYSRDIANVDYPLHYIRKFNNGFVLLAEKFFDKTDCIEDLTTVNNSRIFCIRRINPNPYTPYDYKFYLAECDKNLNYISEIEISEGWHIQGDNYSNIFIGPEIVRYNTTFEYLGSLGASGDSITTDILGNVYCVYWEYSLDLVKSYLLKLPHDGVNPGF
jgi:hypothetical protein